MTEIYIHGEMITLSVVTTSDVNKNKFLRQRPKPRPI